MNRTNLPIAWPTGRILLAFLLTTASALGAEELPVPTPETGWQLGMSESEVWNLLPEILGAIRKRPLQIGRGEQTFRIDRYEFDYVFEGLARHGSLDFYDNKLLRIAIETRSSSTLPESWSRELGTPSRTTKHSLYWVIGPRLWRASLDGRHLEACTLQFLAEEKAFTPRLRAEVLRRFEGTVEATVGE